MSFSQARFISLIPSVLWTFALSMVAVTGGTSLEDAVVCRRLPKQFSADWQRWNMADTFANPKDYFQQCIA
jgi:hypothetical protein